MRDAVKTRVIALADPENQTLKDAGGLALLLAMIAGLQVWGFLLG